MTEQPQGRSSGLTSRQVRDLAGLLCLLVAIIIINVIAWQAGERTGMLSVAGDFVLLGYLLGSAR